MSLLAAQTAIRKRYKTRLQGSSVKRTVSPKISIEERDVLKKKVYCSASNFLVCSVRFQKEDTGQILKTLWIYSLQQQVLASDFAVKGFECC